MKLAGRSVWLLPLLSAGSALAAESHFLKDVAVAPGDTLAGDLSVYRGDLQVGGFVDGNVVVMFGDCRLEPGARISGNLAVVQGALELVSPEQVGGRISQRDFLKNALADEASPFEMAAEPIGGDPGEEPLAVEGDSLEWDDEETSSDDTEVETTLRTFEDEDDVDLFLSFNRVAGLQAGIQLPSGQKPILPGHFADLTGYGAWAFGSKRPEWRVNLRRKVWESPARNMSVYLAGGVHRLTDTQDAWMLPGTENSLAGWLLQLDYRDYYDNRGWSGELGAFFFQDLLHTTVGYFRESYGPMDVGTQWSWSRADRVYRPNLYSDLTGYSESDNEGLRVGLDMKLWREADELENPAWQKGAGLTLTYEKGLDGSAGDWEYERLLGNLRFAFPLSQRRFEHLSGRLLVGSLSGSAPEQYQFRLGGPDALPGYRNKSVDGLGADDHQDRVALDLAGGANSMVLFSLENRFSGDELDFWPLFSLDLLLMADVGQLSGKLEDMTKAGFRSDVGIGVSDEDDDFRLGLFRATDSGEADWRLLFRIQRRF